MSEDYREDINQNVPARMDWTRWWSRKEWVRVVPRGKYTLQAIDVVLSFIWSWLRPVVQSVFETLTFLGPDWVVHGALTLVSADFMYGMSLVICALVVFGIWLVGKLWLARQQRS